MPLTPQQRSERARMGAYAQHAKHGHIAAAAARAGQERKWAKEIDPEGLLSEREIEVRVEARRKQHMAAMRLAQSRKRAGSVGPPETGRGQQTGPGSPTSAPVQNTEEPAASTAGSSTNHAA